jgi:hypothetical protein
MRLLKEVNKGLVEGSGEMADGGGRFLEWFRLQEEVSKGLTRKWGGGEEQEGFSKAKCEWWWCAECGRWTQSCLERKIQMSDFGKEGNFGRVIVWFLRNIQEAGSLHSWSYFCKCRCEEFC